MSKAVRLGMLVLALAGSFLSPAAAENAHRAGAQRLKAEIPVGDAELAGMRAGFFTAAGAQFDFGATVTTTINGQLALQTNLTWTPAGALVQQLSGLGAAIQSQVAADLAKAGITNPVTTNSAATVQTTVPTTPAATPATPATSVASASAPATTVQTSVPATTAAATSVAPATSLASASAPAATVQTNLPATTAAATSVVPATSLANASAPAATVSAPAPTSTPASVTPAATPIVSTPAAALAATNLSGAGTPDPAASPTTVATITNIVPSSSTSGGSTPPAILTGVQLQSATGTTQVLTNIGAHQLQNILINSASNQDIVQNTNLFFTIYNFADWQKQLSQNAISSQLANEIMAAAGFGGSR